MVRARRMPVTERRHPPDSDRWDWDVVAYFVWAAGLLVLVRYL
ncbi:MAG: hypothetical protein AB7R00_29170 [Kofleriaceae bacterium]